MSVPDKPAKLTDEWLTKANEPQLKNMRDCHLSGLAVDQKSDLIAELCKDELVRRGQDKIDQTMLQYTKEVHVFTRQMRCMTVIILIATLVGVFFTILGFVRR